VRPPHRPVARGRRGEDGSSAPFASQGDFVTAGPAAFAAAPSPSDERGERQEVLPPEHLVDR
jgi:hypothetical protein